MKTKQEAQTRTADARCNWWWIVGGVLLVVVALAGYLTWHGPAYADGPDPSKLIGKWSRSDAGYVLELSDPAPDGLLKAAYFNPRPINVSRSEWKRQDGRLSAFIELRDKHYPGSIYTLAYNPATERLVGIYFQASLKQQFEVEFERAK